MSILILGEYLQEIAQAWNTWNTWKSNLLEQKRLRCILSNIARHWKTRVRLRCISTMFFNIFVFCTTAVFVFKILTPGHYSGDCTSLE